jgi:hypothetical protein
MSKVKRVLVIAPVVLLVAACSSTGTVSKSTLEEKAMASITEAAGQAPDAVTCPGDIKAEVGATARCELTAGGTAIGVTITVTSVADGVAALDVKVDSAP